MELRRMWVPQKIGPSRFNSCDRNVYPLCALPHDYGVPSPSGTPLQLGRVQPCLPPFCAIECDFTCDYLGRYTQIMSLFSTGLILGPFF